MHSFFRFPLTLFLYDLMLLFGNFSKISSRGQRNLSPDYVMKRKASRKSVNKKCSCQVKRKTEK